jgi:hypothetical protein
MLGVALGCVVRVPWLARFCTNRVGLPAPCPRTLPRSRSSSRAAQNGKDHLRSVAVGLIDAAAKLKDEAGELPPPVSAKAPDVQPEGEAREGAG